VNARAELTISKNIFFAIEIKGNTLGHKWLLIVVVKGNF
jgi:hypothetical protein